MGEAPPRLVIAGAGGDSGKTLVSLGLAAAWHRLGLAVSAFKKGPDYIDAAWLARAVRRPARNLDTRLMGSEGVLRSFIRHSDATGVAVIEGNRGILDGYEGATTAALARLLEAPVLLVIDATKVTRTAAALVAGCRVLDPLVRIAGVVANRIGGPRHAREVRRAVEEATGVPVLAAIPRLGGEAVLPDRHLGLVPPEEHERMDRAIERCARAMEDHADLDAILALARGAGPLPAVPGDASARSAGSPPTRIGVLRDSAFTFYYPENLEALEAAGARIVPVSALADPGLPDVDLLYLGGGFPETHAAALAENEPMLRSVARAARDGLPMYAECGGLIYLARSVAWRGRVTPLAGVLPVDVEVGERPAGHGYAEMKVVGENPFFPIGTALSGHEFHYSRLTAGAGDAEYCFEVTRGVGCGAGRDGLRVGKVLATWLHLHALGCPEWAAGLVRAAARRGRVPAGAGSET